MTLPTTTTTTTTNCATTTETTGSMNQLKRWILE